MYETRNHKQQYEGLDRKIKIFLRGVHTLITSEPRTEKLVEGSQQLIRNFKQELNDTALTEMSKLGHTKYFIARCRGGSLHESFNEGSIVVEFNINDWYQYETVRMTYITEQNGKQEIVQYIFDTSNHTITRKSLPRKPNGYGALLNAVDGRRVSV